MKNNTNSENRKKRELYTCLYDWHDIIIFTGIVLGILVLAIFIKFIDIVGPMPIKFMAWLIAALFMVKFMVSLYEAGKYFHKEIEEAKDKSTQWLIKIYVSFCLVIIVFLSFVILLY